MPHATMAKPIVLHLDGTTYLSNDPPVEPTPVCDTLLCAFASRQIRSLAIVEAWKRSQKSYSAILANDSADNFADWALQRFRQTADSRDLLRLHLLLGARLHRLAMRSTGDTALGVLVWAEWVQGIEALLQLGRNVGINRRCSFGNGTALHDAVALRQPRIVELLLAYGANPNVRDDGGTAPLHLASALGDDGLAMAHLLVKAGANIRWRVYGPSGPAETALDYARTSGSRALVRYLETCMSATEICASLGN